MLLSRRLRYGEEYALLAAQKHLCRAAVITRATKFSAFATAAALLLAGVAAHAQTVHVVATTTDLASLAQAVAGDLASVDVMIPPGVDHRL